MAELKRAQCSRRGYLTHLKKLLQSVGEILSSTEPLNDDNVTTLRDLLEQLQRKQDLISELDGKILEATKEEDIEAEVLQAEETYSTISTAKARITNRLASIASAELTTTRSSTPPPPSVEHPSESITRLPKLDLPHFTGNPLNWQPFWDCFKAAVDLNRSLTDVQKLSYLRAQLRGEASRVIAGFQLTNASYVDSVRLLQERFGQSYKQIDAHMQALIDLPGPTNSLSSIREFYDATESHIRSLSALGKAEDSYGSLLVPIILSKLPGKIKQNLARSHGKGEWTIHELRTSIRDELYILEIGSQQSDSHTPTQPTASFFSSTSKPPHQPRGKTQCPFCKGPHSALLCESIKDPKQRSDIVRQERLCFNCLGHHKVSSCNSKHRCHHCKRKHHTTLCTYGQQPPVTTNIQHAAMTNVTQQTEQGNATSGTVTTPPAPPQPVTPQPTNQSNTSQFSVTVPPHRNNVCLLKTAVATVSNGRRTTKACILLDEGSQRSFVTSDLAKQLALQPIGQETINISHFGATHPTNQVLDIATINLLTKSGESLQLSVFIVPLIATPLQNIINYSVTSLPHLQGLQLAHPVIAEREFHISLLVGVDYYWDIVQDQVIRGNGPTAVQSKLGYLLSGPIQPSSPNSPATNVFMVASSSSTDFDLERFWNLEAVGVSMTEDHSKSSTLNEYTTSCVTRTDDGAYIARFPWKPNHPDLPSNSAIAKHRTQQLVKRLTRSPPLLKMYNQILTEQESRGFIERVSTVNDTFRTHYIPHHSVEKDSTTTPIRIVFDCSCRQTSKHPSLNDCLMIGLPCLNDLCAILLRFRSHRFGISTDIEKAFLHIQLHPDDRDFTRFYWPKDPTDPSSKLSVYRFKVIPFGATSSPFILNAVLQHHLNQYTTAVSLDMLSNLYVDNVISGCNTEQEVLHYYKESRTIMSSAKFNLRSWASNCAELKIVASQEGTADDNTTVNILGLRWNPNTDEISLASKPSILPYEDLITKREVLQDISKIFDPLGFVSPVVIRAKILMQTLWKTKIAWDEPLNEELHTEWKVIANDLKAASKHSVTRCYFQSPITQPSIHCFADASLKAYGAVVFIVQQDQVSFVMAKARVAPLKLLTLPRLELMATLVATRLVRFVLDTLSLRDPPVYIWSDSQIVLHWVQSEKQLPAFVHHRVSEMKSQHPTACWRYCPTLENPADLLTRGTTFQLLKSSSLWQHGPSWLTTPDQWPVFQLPPLSPLYIAAAIATEFIPQEPSPPAHGLHCIMFIEKYSTLHKLLAVTAYVFRFIGNLKMQSAEHRQTGPLEAEELDRARQNWVKSTQQVTYRKEIANLQLISTNSKTSRVLLVRQLRLFLDSKGFIRCGGRIHNAPLNEVTRFPYLLPSKHPLSQLIIFDIHVSLYHSGTSATLTALRQTYWIPSARQYIKSLLRKCVVCLKVTGKPFPAPDPAPLPQSRMQDVHPFTYTGVDFTGALYVKDGSQEVKVYLCLFTCATTRAVHLEIVQDLTADTFMLAFRKFAGRRSLPRMMISDNGSTYLSAAEELKSMMELPEIKEQLSRRGVTWKFIPKRAPWYGGFWERLVGVTKTAIKKTLGRRHVSLRTLEAIVVEIEAVVNDRPLTFVPSEADDPEPLTPSHLLHGRRITCLPHQMVETDEVLDPSYGEPNQICRQARVQAAILRDFQKRWCHEYLTSLREFHRTSGRNQQNVQKGDVVIIHDDVPRVTWRLAVIKDLIVGGDGLVRAATIRTANRTTTRPITKLYPLELNEGRTLDSRIIQDESVPAAEGHTNATPPPLNSTTATTRPQRSAARRANNLMREWTSVLSGPPEDVTENEDEL